MDYSCIFEAEKTTSRRQLIQFVGFIGLLVPEACVLGFSGLSAHIDSDIRMRTGRVRVSGVQYSVYQRFTKGEIG